MAQFVKSLLRADSLPPEVGYCRIRHNANSLDETRRPRGSRGGPPRPEAALSLGSARPGRAGRSLSWSNGGPAVQKARSARLALRPAVFLISIDIDPLARNRG